MVRLQLLIVTCAACLGVSTRSVATVPSQPILLTQTAQQAKTPFWASPLVLGGIGATSVVGAMTVFVLKRSGRSTPEILEPITPDPQPVTPPKLPTLNSSNGSKPDFPSRNGHTQTETLSQAETLEALLQVVEPPKPALPPKLEETTRLAKVNIVDELIQDLRSPDPAKRRKVIWELGQRGDTRAVQPLVDLLIDSDSKQRSLILSALSEIGTRTLKPMTRALAVSLQDENAEVRKNAIRDLTRVYDMVSQISNLLHKATEDSDKDVQETAKWALNQLSRIRSTPTDTLPALKNSVSPPESLP
ncbi:HEAT repeat domain-containing protein [Leptolyngbya sp. NIES-2104]|uniref:HEAT repeat domain-containing protein n=1 Tax=Leptolyngbya sp. NIES-2104 TaxID=1552121 RepID=UPI0006EC6849|nr:HEAT repeat domain-containing protein [Leptolyngbya sp. NIES-2104]GAP95451.1 peptidoglycan-binding domain 1 [Leptolyngbya sp. NIES-2104]